MEIVPSDISLYKSSTDVSSPGAYMQNGPAVFFNPAEFFSHFFQFLK
jgi:hypothetical protein